MMNCFLCYFGKNEMLKLCLGLGFGFGLFFFGLAWPGWLAQAGSGWPCVLTTGLVSLCQIFFHTPKLIV